MNVPVRLDDIVDALTMMRDDYSSFLDLDRGEVLTVSDALLGESEEAGEWARRVAGNARCRRLPSQFDVHEWSIMQDFARSRESERVRETFLRALNGAGAGRHFQDALRREGVEQAWYDFRTEALRDIAREWCEAEGVAWQ
jgi:hypothetical protein